MKLFKNLIRIAAKNVWLHRKHSLAATISIATGFVSLVVFQGYMKDIDVLYLETFRSRFMYGEAIIEHEKATSPEGKSEPSKYWLDQTSQSFVQEFFSEQKSLVEVSVPFLFVSGTVNTTSGSMIFRGLAYDVQAGAKARERWRWNSVYGVPLDASDNPESALLGQSLAKHLGCTPDKPYQILNSTEGYKEETHPFTCPFDTVQLQSLTISGQLNSVDLEVVGLVDAVYKEVDDKYILMSLQNGQTLLNTDLVSYFTVKLKDASQVHALIKKFNDKATAANLPLKMVRWQDHNVGDLYNRTLDLLGIFRNFVVIIIVSIAGLSIFNIMMKVVKERTREIGTLQSLGFHSWQIQFIFLAEAVFLAVLGSGAGAVLSLITTWVINLLGIVYRAGVLAEPVPFRVMFWGSLYGVAIVLLSLIATVTAAIAIRSTMGKRIADNLTFN